jgi:hypothetical protein
MLVVLLIGTNDLGYTARLGGNEEALLERANTVVERCASAAAGGSQWLACPPSCLPTRLPTHRVPAC